MPTIMDLMIHVTCIQYGKKRLFDVHQPAEDNVASICFISSCPSFSYLRKHDESDVGRMEKGEESIEIITCSEAVSQDLRLELIGFYFCR